MRHAAPTTTGPRTPGSRRTTVIAGGLAAVAAASLLVASPALAAKPGSTAASSGSCVVNPNPVAAGADWTMSATGLGSNTFVNVLISDVKSTTAWNLQATSTGTLSLTTFSYWAGTSKITIQKSAKHGWTTLATCSFSVT